MARIGSGDSWDVATWDQGDNPGAGSQDFTVFNDTGLNGNFKRLWRGAKLGHNPDGTHRDDVIDGNSLKSSVADNTTIETSAGSGAKTLRVKDGGITTAKIAALAITTALIAANAVTAAKIANATITATQIANATITTTQIANNTIVSANCAADVSVTYLFGDQRVAGAAAGNTPAAIDEWIETSTSYVQKISFIYTKITGDKYIKLSCYAHGNGGKPGWNCKLTVGGVDSTVQTDVNTSYNLAAVANCNAQVDVSGFTVGKPVEVQVNINCGPAGAGGQTNISYVSIYTTKA